MKHLDLKNISFGFNSSLLFNDLNLSIPLDKSTLVTGKNGAGKTTLFKLIAGLLAPDKGLISIDGQNINNLNVNQRMKVFGIGYVMQENYLFDDLSVADNLKVAKTSYSHESIINDELIENFLEFSRDSYRKKAINLSGGERKKLAIAIILRAGVNNFIFMDEPFAGLSEKASEELLNCLTNLKVEFGLHFAIVEHKEKFLNEICNNTIELK